jgi:hypothetical protein
MPHQLLLHNNLFTYAFLRLFSLQFSYPTNAPKALGYPHTIINPPPTPLHSAIHTVHNHFHYSFKLMYIVINAVELKKVSTPSQKPTPFLF